MPNTKEIKLTLIKNEAGITASNEDAGTIDLFDDSDEQRQEFIRYMLDGFINAEVDDGKKYN
jgi:hypothetical protein